MENPSQVVIVGAGELGRAVGVLLKEKNINVEFWDANPTAVPGQKPLQELIPGASHVLFCVPSWAMRAAVAGILPYITPGAASKTTIVSFSKGIDKDAFQTMAEMVPALLPAEQPFMTVSGPMLAAEIVGGMAAVGVFASTNEAALAWAVSAFGSEHFRVETTTDTASVALAGVLKNIYAVALGIADGLGLSGNEKGWITARAIDEMAGLATALGADPHVIMGTAGVGDFIATGYSVHSRNRETGIEIVTTGKCDIRGEGLNSLPFLIARLGDKASSFPLLMLVHQVGVACAPARPAFEQYFKTSAI